MIRLNDQGRAYVVDSHDVEFGVRYTPFLSSTEIVSEQDDEEEARFVAAVTGGKVVIRDVFVTEWADAPST